MAYTIVSIAGKQYWLELGGTLSVDGVMSKPGQKLQVGKALLTSADSLVEVGTPELKTKLEFEVLDTHKSEKIRVATYKSKSRYRKVRGHRQDQTLLRLVKVGDQVWKEAPMKSKSTDKVALKTDQKEKSTKKTSTQSAVKSTSKTKAESRPETKKTDTKPVPNK